MRRVHVYVSGQVQGVFFRASTQTKAQELNVLGLVRNLPDGRVEIVAEADTQAIEAFLDWCRKGPPGANVQALQVKDEAVLNQFTEFDIRY